MSKHYELMDLTSGNIVGDYETEDEALEIVRRGAMDYGVSAVAELGLSETDGDGTRVIAMRSELLERSGALQPAQSV